MAIRSFPPRFFFVIQLKLKTGKYTQNVFLSE